jgi:hypothetical protein
MPREIAPTPQARDWLARRSRNRREAGLRGCGSSLNDLEDAGHVLRRRDPSDRRRHIVEMTPKGARALAHAERKLETVEDEVLGNLNASERTTLRDLLAKALEGKSANGE